MDSNKNFATKGSVNAVLTALGGSGLDVNDARFATKEDLLKIAAAVSGGRAPIEFITTSGLTELKKGTLTVVTDSPAQMALEFGFENPSEIYQSEYVLVFRAGETTTLTMTMPDGYALTWADGEPEWTAGALYEINFLSLEKAINENKIIGALYKEYTEAV